MQPIECSPKYAEKRFDMNHPIDLDPETSTDAFNQARSKQGRLTYSRLGGILSAMGFTRAKTANGCSAILWDDQLLLW